MDNCSKTKIERLISGYDYGRYIEDGDLDRGASRRFLTAGIVNTMAKGDSRHLIEYDSTGNLAGLLLFRLSGWDSQHFGLPVALIDGCYLADRDYSSRFAVANRLLEQFDRWSCGEGIRFVAVKAPSLDLPLVHAYEKWGFGYIESWVFNRYNLNRFDSSAMPLLPLRLARPEDREYMNQYSQGAFDTQRFHADFRIPRDKADSLYLKWIETSYTDPTQSILVYEPEGKPAAFMIFYINDFRAELGVRYVQWKMALLDPALRGKGIGNSFFHSLLHHHRQAGDDVVDSGLSMRNLVSLNLHNRIGFKIISTIVTFHKWIKPNQQQTVGEIQ